MIKRSIFITNPYHLSTKNRQLVLRSKDQEIRESQIPIEDIGFAVFENPQITFTQSVIELMAKNNVALIFCSRDFMPVSMLFHLDTHSIQTERFRAQINASEPLKKKLWKQTVKQKIHNQAIALELCGKDNQALVYLVKKVKSGDPENIEGRAAKRYWASLFPNQFRRDRFGEGPNPALNYGYTILRSAVARALAGSGLLSSLGIHHRNRYNSFCLADDIMEPYRPYVDLLVKEMLVDGLDTEVLGKMEKAHLLKILTCDVVINKRRRPLMVGLSETTSSLAKCFEGERTTILFPKL
tara:strand:+ start:6257 stop:7147 length:891 start_codon:yes stop_codon:yes gene_type:complete